MAHPPAEASRDAVDNSPIVRTLVQVGIADAVASDRSEQGPMTDSRRQGPAGTMRALVAAGAAVGLVEASAVLVVVADDDDCRCSCYCYYSDAVRTL